MALLIAVSAALAVPGFPAAAQNHLGMADLKTLISGNTVHFQNLSSGRTGRAYYAPSGEILIKRDDGVEFAGLWSIGANGAHCLILTHEICAKIEKNADGSYTRVVNGTPELMWTKISPGKAL